MPALLTTKSLTRKKILELILAYFLLTDKEKEALILAIHTALRSSMIAAYNWNSFLLGITIQYIPTKEQETLLNDLAQQRSMQIAETYEKDITNAATRILDAFQDTNGTLDGVLPELRETLKQYTDARTEQKASDISTFETSEGANKGTQNLIDDIIDSEDGDNVYVSPEDMANIFVGVLPDYALTEDECEEFAGEMWPVLDATDIPDFPIHNRCIHYKSLIDMRDEAA